MEHVITPESKPARDELLMATRRYSAMVAHDPDAKVLPALAWRGIAIRLWAKSHGVTGQRQKFLRDRANDAHNRADDARRHGASGGRYS